MNIAQELYNIDILQQFIYNEETRELGGESWQNALSNKKTDGNCAYAAAALFEVLDSFRLKPSILVLFGTRYDKYDEDRVDCLIHAVVDINGWQVDLTAGERTTPQERSILDHWEDSWLECNYGDDPDILGTCKYTKENYDQYWKHCAKTGSPKNDELVEEYKKKVERAILAEFSERLEEEHLNLQIDIQTVADRIAELEKA